MSANPNEDIRAIGHKIGMLRQNTGYSQEKLAELVGLSKTALGNIERGQSVPKTETIICVCQALNVSPNEVFPAYLSENNLDCEMAALVKKAGTLSPSQKKQFIAMMNVVYSGIKNPES